MQNKFKNPELTAEQQNLYNTIITLQSLIESATLNTAEMIDTIHGAKSSAVIYSIVETAKANNLKPFDYV